MKVLDTLEDLLDDTSSLPFSVSTLGPEGLNHILALQTLAH